MDVVNETITPQGSWFEEKPRLFDDSLKTHPNQ
jgi:hypothetical protein